MKYHKLTENAAKPAGFWGRLMIRSMNRGHSALTDWALDYVPVENGFRVLDIGCGGGRRKNILCGRAEIRKGSVSELPFAEESFDLVTAVETYYFWPDKLGDLAQVYRVLKRGGRLLLVFEMLRTEDNPDRWKPVEERLHIKAVSCAEIRDILLRAGYQNIRTHTKSGTSWLCATAEKE